MDYLNKAVWCEGVVVGRIVEVPEDASCDMEGCRGTQVLIEYPDGEKLLACGRGLEPYNGGYRILE